MGLFKKKADPISERAKALKAEIADLESRIKKLSNQADSPAQVVPRPRPVKSAPTPPSSPEPVFVDVNNSRLKPATEPEVTDDHYNDLGVRKYDLASTLRRWKNNFRGRAVPNPKLVTFLAAGSIQGLRPLRYEKRVARNRFIFFSTIFFVCLVGLLYLFLKQR